MSTNKTTKLSNNLVNWKNCGYENNLIVLGFRSYRRRL